MEFVSRTTNFLTFGAIDRRKAKEIAKSSDGRQKAVKQELEKAKKHTQEDLQELGEVKAEIYSTTLSDFVSAYEVIGAVDLSALKMDSSLEARQFSLDVVNMKDVSISLKDVAIAGGGAALGGAVAVCGAWGLATTVGVASSGTAIGTLTGVAATNATLAWLGGGAISAGGAGMAGGMVVLGGVALAPVAIVAMFFGVNKGKQRINNAEEYSRKVDVLVTKCDTLIAELSQVRRGCYLMLESIRGLDAVLSKYVEKMNNISLRLESRSVIRKRVVDPVKKHFFKMSLLTDDESQIFCDSANCASLLKQLMDRSLMNEEGGFLSDVLEYVETNRHSIDRLIVASGVAVDGIGGSALISYSQAKQTGV